MGHKAVTVLVVVVVVVAAAAAVAVAAVVVVAAVAVLVITQTQQCISSWKELTYVTDIPINISIWWGTKLQRQPQPALYQLQLAFTSGQWEEGGETGEGIHRFALLLAPEGGSSCLLESWKNFLEKNRMQSVRGTERGWGREEGGG